MDYIEIQQLVNRLNFALDYCGNGGRDFAALFTDDGQYVIDEGGKLRTIRGRRSWRTRRRPGLCSHAQPRRGSTSRI